MTGLLTDRVSLDEYMGVWFRCEVSEAVENVGATSGWVMRLKRDQEDDVSLLGLLDTFVHRMYKIVRKTEKDAANACLQMLACKCLLANACLQMLSCKCLLANAANASCICRLQLLAFKCLLANACCKRKLHMQAANACLQMQAANAGCKCLVANAKASSKFKVQILDENASYKCFTEYIIP
ncbi:hypothetical protein Tco_1369370 [Tanacetum coccineum]